MGDNRYHLALVAAIRDLCWPEAPAPKNRYDHPERRSPAGFRDHGLVDHRAAPPVSEWHQDPAVWRPMLPGWRGRWWNERWWRESLPDVPSTPPGREVSE